ncbi:FecR family protein [Epsilonproteobacteria bacterium SCGC AD-308-E02]|jgi:hypothetical protein|nr:FecR family protein [Epsilonproteobacteria bacterium SCGC AD-308-O04]SMP87677.1 FecR family protein [Epsilonproteobacteria bacterium SCGC AD-308-E02]
MKIFNLIILLGMFSFILANEAALVKKLKGNAHIVREGKELAIGVGTKVLEKDKIITQASSSVGLIFKDNTRISVGSNSEFTVEEYMFNLSEKKEVFTTNLSKGSLECVTGLISKINPKAFQLKAKTATMGIRGTHFIVDVN